MIIPKTNVAGNKKFLLVDKNNCVRVFWKASLIGWSSSLIVLRKCNVVYRYKLLFLDCFSLIERRSHLLSLKKIVVLLSTLVRFKKLGLL